MVFIILTIIFILSVLFGKYFFKKNINPVFIYSFIWYVMLICFHLKLIEYRDLTIYAWVLIAFSYLSFLLGIMVYYTASRNFNVKLSRDEDLKVLQEYLFHNKGRILQFLIVFFSILGLVGAVQHWSILFKKYGSFTEIFLHLGRIRQLTVQGEIEGILPYISSFSFVAIFFAGFYSAIKNRITLISFLPMIAIILKDMAAAGRVGILIGFMEYGITFIFTSYYLKSQKSYIKPRNNYINIFTILLIFIIFLSSIFFIKGLRGGSEDLKGASRKISRLDNNLFITPTLYLYFSGHVGVLSEYLRKDEESSRFGENTFRFVYNVLSKIGVGDEAEMYQKPYRIPVWINTGTFLRELHSDFGTGGTLVFLFFLGITISYFWQNFYERGNFIHLVLLVYFNLIIALSFLMMITRITTWSIGLLTIITVNYILKQFYYRSLHFKI